ncbi:hypothetical protein AYO41_05545 [Verrucomicrobia bacterium SCGC AG-212-E04]|nr:hypothetical protein AYO41_05545 [Verrucomicrobia bacterium SCGC AG-212-E04]
MNEATRSMTGRRVLLALAVWLGLAILLSVLGVWERARIPMPLVGLTLIGIVLAIIGVNARVRAWAYSLDPRWLVGIHLVRFVGFLFFVMHSRGELPWAFAVPGGWGDNITAAGAVVLLLAVLPVRSRPSWLALLVWNIFGFLDILFVVSTAFRLILTEPASMTALLRLPLSMLPAFFVPLIIVSHLILFAWLKRHPAGGNSNGFAGGPF